MRATWSAFHLSFLSKCQRHSADRGYRAIMQSHSELVRFGSIEALLHNLHSPGGDAAERNQLLLLLVVVAQADADLSDLATTMLILALWPGLDAVHTRLCYGWREQRADMAGDVLSHVAIGIRQLDLNAVTWIAATLIRNVERDIGRRLVRARKRRSEEVAIDAPDIELQLADPMTDAATGDADDLRARLMPLFGQDTAFFLRIIHLGETQAEAGLALDLSPDAARKRYQRGLGRIRAAEKISDLPVPFGPAARPLNFSGPGNRARTER